MSRPDYVVFIGRFQPFHNGHLKILKHALTRAKKSVIVVLGSANAPRTIKNPFTASERQNMISASVSEADAKRLSFVAIEDSVYNNAAWFKSVTSSVEAAALFSSSIALIGHKKDASSFYIDMFPQWEKIEMENVAGLSSTPIRESYFTQDDSLILQSKELPEPVRYFMFNFVSTQGFRALKAEYDHIAKYRKAWEAAPYAPTFVTVDACVVQSNHVLLVQRRAEPGKGLWALPGGFLNPQETIEDGALRELKEETKIDVPVPVLRGSIRATKVFDDPNRSMRGRTITHAYLIHLSQSPTAAWTLPKVKGSDDAAKARWWPLSHVQRSMMFEDHMDIILNLTARL